MKTLERQFAQTIREHKSTIYTVCYMFSKDARRSMVRAKKFENDWLFVGIPLLVMWLAWFFWEAYKINNDLFNQPLGIGGIVGTIIGTVIGLSIHLKNQRQYKEILDQIDELTE